MQQDTFFKQSSLDALNDYLYSVREGKGENWDWLVLTAASEQQADVFRIQIEKRKNEKWLPARPKIIVVPDYRNERIGSGGATLNVLRVIGSNIGFENLLDSRILIIHSGGDSKRIPQYSACGKLFAPVPRMLPNGNISALFDELLILASGIPGRTGKGIMIFPSDTELLFNPLQLDLMTCDAAGLSMKASVSEGKEHGVFLQGSESSDKRNRNAAKFLHKFSEKALRQAGAADARDQVDIDTGCIWLGRKVAGALCELICTEGKFDEAKFEKYVNPKVCLNFYADFVYPLADSGTLEEFLNETPENGMTEELLSCRRTIWDKLHQYHLSLVKMAPARYIHFGMTQELFDLFVNDIALYSYLGWSQRVNTNAESGTVLNSYVSEDAEFFGKSLIENSLIRAGVKIGDGTVLSNIEAGDCFIPDGIVLSGIRLRNGRYVCRIYGREDNPKASGTAPFLGGSIEKLIRMTGASRSEIWGASPASVWNAAVYPEKDSMEEAVKAALSIQRIMNGTAESAETQEWKKSVKQSLKSSFSQADMHYQLKWQDEIRRTAKLEIFYKAVFSGCSTEPEINKICRGYSAEETEEVLNSIISRAKYEKFPNSMRLYLAVSDICRKYLKDSERAGVYEEKAYENIRKYITDETFSRFCLDYHIVSFREEKVVAELPVRVNFCGSPSDAAPYCLEHGGTMVNGALLLKGKKPIRATIEKTEWGIAFSSIDQGISLNLDHVQDVRSCGCLSDPFALHKAVLLATGLVPMTGDIHSEDFFKTIGGGLKLTTEASVPKGSGLGTSSIMAAAAVKAVHLAFGLNASDEMIYAQVFLAEQLMNTGGGWQDQAGGLTEGIKYLTTAPGGYQKIDSEVLSLPKKTVEELNSRFALIFSGQRRLARNVLREEMNQCIRNDRKALDAVKKIQEYCAVMRHYLLKGEITEFAAYVTKQFELVKILDRGASNTCIEYIFDVIDDLIDGKSVCGAGGGGFLQVILKKGVLKEQLWERIEEEFAGCGVEVWDCELV